MRKALFNPFIYLAGTKALLLGLSAMLLTAVIGYFSHVRFNGAIDMHFGGSTVFMTHLAEQLVDLLSLSLFFMLGGMLFSNSSIRLIDILGTVALARWPLLFTAIIGFGIEMPPAADLTNIENIKNAFTPLVIVLSGISVVFVIWMIALLYNAFSISCNLKGGKATLIFITCLILAEVVSVYIIHLLP